MAALVGLWVTGIVSDLRLRLLILGSTAVFAVEVVVPGLAFASPAAVLVSIAAWGPAFGGSGSLQKTALTNAAGTAFDVSQSFLVTGLNIGTAAGGILGGLVLSGLGSGALPFATLVLLVVVLVIVRRPPGWFPRASFNRRIVTHQDVHVCLQERFMRNEQQEDDADQHTTGQRVWSEASGYSLVPLVTGETSLLTNLAAEHPCIPRTKGARSSFPSPSNLKRRPS